MILELLSLLNLHSLNDLKLNQALIISRVRCYHIADILGLWVAAIMCVDACDYKHSM